MLVLADAVDIGDLTAVSVLRVKVVFLFVYERIPHYFLLHNLYFFPDFPVQEAPIGVIRHAIRDIRVGVEQPNRVRARLFQPLKLFLKNMLF